MGYPRGLVIHTPDSYFLSARIGSRRLRATRHASPAPPPPDGSPPPAGPGADAGDGPPWPGSPPAPGRSPGCAGPPPPGAGPPLDGAQAGLDPPRPGPDHLQVRVHQQRPTAGGDQEQPQHPLGRRGGGEVGVAPPTRPALAAEPPGRAASAGRSRGSSHPPP